MKKIIIGFLFFLIISPVLSVKISAANLEKEIERIDDQVNAANDTLSSIGGLVNSVGKIFDDENDWGWGSSNNGSAELPDGEFELPSDSEYNMVHTTSLRTFIQNVLNFVITFVGIIGIAAVIYAGYLYIMAGGDDGNIDKAKKIVIYVAIGILVISASYAIVNTVINETVTGGDDRGGSSVDSQNNVFEKIQTNFAPGTTLPAGTVVGNGLRLLRDTIVDNDGTVSISSDLIKNTDSLDLVELLSFQNGITVSGESVSDLGNTVIIPNESASSGIDFGLTVQATALFDFGDGTQGILDTISNPSATISHRFGKGKTYQVRVKSQTADGLINSFSKKIVVGGTNASFSLSKNKVLVGEKVVLDGNRSSVSIGSIQSYNWSCSGGTGCFADIEEPSITASFGEAGTYTVSLTINNAIGVSDTKTKIITVLNDEPIAAFVFENANNTEISSEFRFDASDSQNIEGNSDNLVYKWTFDNNIVQKTSPITTYRFKTEGKKTVSLVVIQRVNGKKLTSEKVSETVDVQTTLSPDFNISQ